LKTVAEDEREETQSKKIRAWVLGVCRNGATNLLAGGQSGSVEKEE
jgi:hypothetical protein